MTRLRKRWGFLSAQPSVAGPSVARGYTESFKDPRMKPAPRRIQTTHHRSGIREEVPFSDGLKTVPGVATWDSGPLAF